jgi:hypothetical protein
VALMSRFPSCHDFAAYADEGSCHAIGEVAGEMRIAL